MRAQFSRRGISLPLKSHFMQFFNNLSDIINIKQLSPISILSRSPNHNKPWRPPIFFRPSNLTNCKNRRDILLWQSPTFCLHPYPIGIRPLYNTPSRRLLSRFRRSWWLVRGCIVCSSLVTRRKKICNGIAHLLRSILLSTLFYAGERVFLCSRIAHPVVLLSFVMWVLWG